MKVLSVVLLAAVCVVMLPEAWSGVVTSGPVTTSWSGSSQAAASDQGCVDAHQCSGPVAAATSAYDAQAGYLYKYYSGNSYNSAYTLLYCQAQCRQRGYARAYISNGWCYCQYQQTNWSWGGLWGWGDDD